MKIQMNLRSCVSGKGHFIRWTVVSLPIGSFFVLFQKGGGQRDTLGPIFGFIASSASGRALKNSN